MLIDICTSIDIIICGYSGAEILLPYLSSSMLMHQKKLLHTIKKMYPMHVIVRHNSFSDQNTIKNLKI